MSAIFPLLFVFAQQGVMEKQIDASNMAGRVLAQTRQAREALAAGDKAAAARYVDEGVRLSDELRKALAAAGKPAVVPVSVEVETASLYGPVKRRKSETLTARRMKRETSVRQVTGETTSITLDVGMAHNHLEAARTALAEGDLSGADARLLALENGVERRTVSADLPLLKVRQNLDLARARVQDAKYKDAAAPLRAAAEALADYRTLSPGPRSDEAGILRQEIADYAERIGRDHADALLHIDRWRDKVAGWYPPVEPK